MLKRVLLAGLLAVVALPAQAEYTVKGGVECPDIVKEDADEHYREYNKWWLLGYITGRNYQIDLGGNDSNAGRDVESDAIYAMALEWCRNNPGNDWDDAAIQLFDRLSGAPAQTGGQGKSEGSGTGTFPAPGGSSGSGGGAFPTPKAN
jgi:uncharacterized membrane protein YgcG